jgi:hypothetical protein
MRIGLVQTSGIGDIIIALPIADYFLSRGDDVYWPIDRELVPAFSRVEPRVHFLPIYREVRDRIHAVEAPVEALKLNGCQRIVSLYSAMVPTVQGNPSNTGLSVGPLARSLKFDEYKYAVAGVPFRRKWELKLVRDRERERQLEASLGITRPYICVHSQGSQYAADFEFPSEWQERFQRVDVKPVTDSIFDWLEVLEGASKLVLVDSCFANLVEQMGFAGVEKYLMLRSEMAFTPVYASGWRFMWMTPSERSGQD